MAVIPEAVLSSGHKIPILGLGTGVDPSSSPPDFMKAAFVTSMELGYRHFDTAALYGTEKPLGEAIVEALRSGIIKSREELFITSKLWCSDVDQDCVLPAIQNTLKNLQLEYLDLYLIHWPVRATPGKLTFSLDKKDLFPMDYKSTWEAMEECVKLGLTKSIGVSNFSCKKLSELLENAMIPPAVNQVEMNPVWNQKKLRDFCKEKGIHITAWSPLGASGNAWGTPAVMESPVIKEIAAAKGKTVAQVALRWVHQQGVSVVVKSVNKDRMQQNLSIFDWELSEEEEQQINEIPQARGFSGILLVSPDGPFKSLEELWDGEI
ncbi:non-functional NADPH-dependent codeinone reductase 2-like [Tasmannia lanceolata]|uniref:non-functional NADPH-dependent codeinone reductase 2-like n=1 Tax=Tasmannia lanceolata TaxID=3420 RepID=UPI00406464D4